MLTYNMDVTPESVWKRTTPSEAELAQPYYCTEAGVFYAQQHFSTARTDKESYILFYTLRGAGLIEQGESHVVLSTGQALLLNCAKLTVLHRTKVVGIIIGFIWMVQGPLLWSRYCFQSKN